MAHVTAPPQQVTPSLCGSYRWASPAGIDAKLAIAAFPDGAAVLEVPVAGGDLTSFNILGDGSTVAAAPTVRPGPFTTVSASVVDEQVEFAVGGATGLELYNSDPLFLQPTAVGTLPGSLVGEMRRSRTVRGQARSRSAAAASGVFVTAHRQPATGDVAHARR